MSAAKVSELRSPSMTGASRVAQTGQPEAHARNLHRGKSSRCWRMRHRQMYRLLRIITAVLATGFSAASRAVAGALAGLILGFVILLVALSVILPLVHDGSVSIEPSEAQWASIGNFLFTMMILGAIVGLVRVVKTWHQDAEAQQARCGSAGMLLGQDNRLAAVDLTARAVAGFLLGARFIQIQMPDHMMDQPGAVHVGIPGSTSTPRSMREHDERVLLMAGIEAMLRHAPDQVQHSAWFANRWKQTHELIETQRLDRVQVQLPADLDEVPLIEQARVQARHLLADVPADRFKAVVDLLLKHKAVDDLDVAEQFVEYYAQRSGPWFERAA